MPRAEKRRLGRQPRAVHEKKQRNGDIGQPADRRCRFTARRHQEGDSDGSQDGGEELVDAGPTARVLSADNLLRARAMAEAWDEHADACEVPVRLSA